MPKALILRAPGTNCDAETAYAFQRAHADADVVHLNRLLESPRLIENYQILCIPGGFSFGDDVAAGKIFATRLVRHMGDRLSAFRDDGKLILGICNGFQTLLKTGLFDVPHRPSPQATLTWNDSGRFLDRWVRLRVSGDRSVFLARLDAFELPVAHAEGKFLPRDESTLVHFAQRDQLALRYDDGSNPNGSIADVAGICDATGRVLGLMPHPERFVDATQHPEWTRRRWDGSSAAPPAAGTGLKIFENAVRYFA